MGAARGVLLKVQAAEKRWRAEPGLTTPAIRERFGLSNSTAADLAAKLRAEGVLVPLNTKRTRNPMTNLM